MGSVVDVATDVTDGECPAEVHNGSHAPLSGMDQR